MFNPFKAKERMDHSKAKDEMIIRIHPDEWASDVWVLLPMKYFHRKDVIEAVKKALDLHLETIP